MLAYMLLLWLSLAEDTVEYKPENSAKAQRLNIDEESAELMKEWQEYMQGFVPADMITFELNPRATEEFFEEVDVLPSFIRGAWFVSSSESRDIDFSILDPSKNSIVQQKGKKEGIFYFDAKRRGEYSFVFKNTKMIQKHLITFALHCGNSTEELLKEEHLSPFEQQLLEVQKSVKDFQLDQQFAQLRMESHYKTVADANRNVFWFSLLECLGVVLVTAWQIFYIKKLLDNRRVL